MVKTPKPGENKQERLTERASFLEDLYEEWKLTLDPGIRKAVGLSRPILSNVVQSYLDDLARFKEYHHEIKLADLHKVAAYTSKWIVFLRPILISCKELPNNQKSVIILSSNELFALHCGLSIMGIKGLGGIEQKLRLNLLYTFRYRHFTGRTLSTIFCLVDRLYGTPDG